MTNSIGTINTSKILDFLFCLAMLFSGAGDFGWMPLNFFQIIVLMMFIIELVRRDFRLSVSKKIIFLLLYILLISFINIFDFETIKSIGYFAIMIYTLYLYFMSKNGYASIFKSIWKVACVVSVYGIVQEIAFFLNIPQIYDLSFYGFARNGDYIWHGMLRAMSFFAEPSSACGIVSIAVLIGLLSDGENYSFVKKWQLICVFIYAFCTFSTIVYGSVLATVLLYIFFYKKRGESKSKSKWIGFILLLIVIVLISNGSMISQVFGKFSQFKSLQIDTGNDLTALAIVSNFQIALLKMKDGYLFGTGFDSHRIYYFDYINRIYSSLYMYLNIDEAASLYTRIFSEFGLIGICAFVFVLLQKIIYSIKHKNHFKVILAFMFAILTLRNGDYVNIFNMTLFILVFIMRKYDRLHGGYK